MKEILIGTHNRHKVEEISKLLAGIPVKLKCLKDFPEISPIEEDGSTLEENAVKKAQAYSKATGLFTVADDTGLEVAALGGAPGVYSARYAGEDCSFKDNNAKLIHERAAKKNGDRRARFRCVIACIDPKKDEIVTVEGYVDGEITSEVKGDQGFGYDPVFYVPELKKTLAELTLDEKNKISHRFKAIINAKKVIENYAKNPNI